MALAMVGWRCSCLALCRWSRLYSRLCLHNGAATFFSSLPTVLKSKIIGYTWYKRVCAIEQQAASCIWPVHEAKRALSSTGSSLELGSLHTQGALFRESMSHQPRVQIGYWVNQLSPVKWWGDVPTGSKSNVLNQPKDWEPCTMHCSVIKKKCVESRALQANSCDNWTKGTAN